MRVPDWLKSRIGFTRFARTFHQYTLKYLVL